MLETRVRKNILLVRLNLSLKKIKKNPAPQRNEAIFESSTIEFQLIESMEKRFSQPSAFPPNKARILKA